MHPGNCCDLHCLRWRIVGNPFNFLLKIVRHASCCNISEVCSNVNGHRRQCLRWLPCTPLYSFHSLYSPLTAFSACRTALPDSLKKRSIHWNQQQNPVLEKHKMWYHRLSLHMLKFTYYIVSDELRIQEGLLINMGTFAIANGAHCFSRIMMYEQQKSLTETTDSLQHEWAVKTKFKEEFYHPYTDTSLLTHHDPSPLFALVPCTRKAHYWSLHRHWYHEQEAPPPRWNKQP